MVVNMTGHEYLVGQHVYGTSSVSIMSTACSHVPQIWSLPPAAVTCHSTFQPLTNPQWKKIVSEVSEVRVWLITVIGQLILVVC